MFPRSCGAKDPLTHIRDLLRDGRVSKVLAIIAELSHDNIKEDMKITMMRRRMFTSTLAWAIPDQGCLDAIVKFAGGYKILEVGCGSGLWAGLLGAMGATVTATDPFLTHGFDPAQTFVEVERMDAVTAIAMYANHRVLMIIWPSAGDAFAVDALRAFTGNRLVYIGEYEGCTANQDFFNELNENWNEEKIIDIPKWYGLYDYCSFYSRK